LYLHFIILLDIHDMGSLASIITKNRNSSNIKTVLP